jgi:hypothetical protein
MKYLNCIAEERRKNQIVNINDWLEVGGGHTGSTSKMKEHQRKFLLG